MNVVSANVRALAAPQNLRDRVPQTLWVSLRYFNVYRLALSALFLISASSWADFLRFGENRPQLFFVVSLIYLSCALLFQYPLHRLKRYFDLQLISHVVVDISAIVLLSHASGGYRSGVELMLLISLAAAALVSYGRLILAFTALASIAVLLEQFAWVLLYEHSTQSFLQPGLLSIGFFATAIIGNQLAQRVIANELIARERGEALAKQVKVNELVIRDLQDGVLVVDADCAIVQHNPQAGVLMAASELPGNYLGRYSTELAHALRKWRAGEVDARVTFTIKGRKIQARFVQAGVSGGLTVIYLEDESEIEGRARQVKLAALGRLTANVAHEIRNPLSAIVHAADLMEEENRAPARSRLTRIIRDNAGRLDRMVTDILELNRRDRTQREPLELRGFLAHCVREIAENEGISFDGIVLQFECDATVSFDRVHLNQVLWNLVRNAWRHSYQQPGSVRLTLLRNEHRLELHVTDDGEGVPAHLQSHLFEPFFTTFSVGTGLGLYIARELCSANDASLDYVTGGQGADFRISWQNVPV
ncbi:MAG TPA: ATP-binding protein [Burkholderiales bacterium]|nr:ATP-binding protein [Burkholderiales bacterium]